MTTLKVTSFGGEIPRLPARALSAGAAQTSLNLLATATEFRPLMGDAVVGAAPVGANTLYRLSRDAAGALRTVDSQGWLAEAVDKSYVKGQINDDATERTYVSFNSGTSQPLAINALGVSRLMGVPTPGKPTLALKAVDEYTLSEATLWAAGTLVPALLAIAKDELYESEPQPGLFSIPAAGPYNLRELTFSAAVARRLSYIGVTATLKTQGLLDPAIGVATEGSNTRISITCLPFWGIIQNRVSVQNKLRLLLSPR